MSDETRPVSDDETSGPGSTHRPPSPGRTPEAHSEAPEYLPRSAPLEQLLRDLLVERFGRPTRRRP